VGNIDVKIGIFGLADICVRAWASEIRTRMIGKLHSWMNTCWDSHESRFGLCYFERNTQQSDSINDRSLHIIASEQENENLGQGHVDKEIKQ
jgi:hypothetical protein